MLELTKEECLELEKQVAEKLHSSFPNEGGASQRMYEILSQMASRAAIMTIREYERMKVSSQDQPPNSP